MNARGVPGHFPDLSPLPEDIADFPFLFIPVQEPGFTGRK